MMRFRNSSTHSSLHCPPYLSSMHTQVRPHSLEIADLPLSTKSRVIALSGYISLSGYKFSFIPSFKIRRKKADEPNVGQDPILGPYKAAWCESCQGKRHCRWPAPTRRLMLQKLTVARRQLSKMPTPEIPWGWAEAVPRNTRHQMAEQLGGDMHTSGKFGFYYQSTS